MIENTGAPTPEEILPPRYAGLNIRMIASSVDMLLLIILTESLIEDIANRLWAPVNFELAPGLKEQMQGQPGIEAMQQLVTGMQDPHFWAHFMFTNVMQTLFLGALSIVCWAQFGATPGMLIFRMRIKDPDTDEKISYLQAFVRFIGYLPAALPAFLGFFWIIWDKRKQGWHDKLANSVVTLPPKKKKKWF